MNIKTTINVTQEMIDKGHRGQCFTCPISIAILAVLKPSLRAYVGDNTISIRNSERIIFRRPTQKAVREFIAKFDARQPVLPFTFTLPIPAELLREEGAK